MSSGGRLLRWFGDRVMRSQEMRREQRDPHIVATRRLKDSIAESGMIGVMLAEVVCRCGGAIRACQLPMSWMSILERK